MGTKIRILKFLAIVTPILLFFTFGLYHLGKFHTADEDIWFANPATGRVHAYWDAIRSGNWEATKINDKPGVTTALISGSVGLLVDTEPNRKIVEQGEYYLVSDPEISEKTAFFFRLPILTANGILILIAFFLLKKYTGNIRTSYALLVLLSLSPTLVGISQIVNPDSTLWSLSFVALLSFFVFLKRGGRRYLVLTAITAGLALLDKYTAVFLLVLIPILAAAHVAFYYAETPTKELFQNGFKRALTAVFAVFAGATAIFFILMPAAFADPSLLYAGTFGFAHSRNITILSGIATFVSGLLLADTYILGNRILQAVSSSAKRILPYLFLAMGIVILGFHLFSLINWTFDNKFDLPSSIAFDQAQGSQFRALSFLKKVAFETKPIVFTLTPVALFFFLFETAYGIFHFKRKSRSFLSFSLLSFILLFYIAILFQDLLIDARYGIMLYPAILLMAALGIESFREILERFLPENRRKATFGIFYSGIFLFSILSLSSSVPFYFNYTNSLLPKRNSVTTGWGYGGYEAAQYLNALPNAKSLVAWADYEGFCKFFVGKCIRGSAAKKYGNGDFDSIDYYVVSRRGSKLQKKLWSDMRKSGAADPDSVWELLILDRENNFIRIHKRNRIEDTRNVSVETEGGEAGKTPGADRE